MKKALVSILLFLLTSSIFSQPFSLQDTRYNVGNYYRSFNVLFDFAKSTLRPQSYANLDSVVTFLNTNPKVKLEIGVHSDYRGTALANTNLTQSRAVSIMNYFISKGINSQRLKAVGYGETSPIYSEKELENQSKCEPDNSPIKTNRRVEYKILSI